MAGEVIKPHVSGLYEHTFTNAKGVVETKLITLSEAMLNVGIWSVAAQDDVLSALADQMTDQTGALEDINDLMALLDIFKRAFQDFKVDGQMPDERPVPLLPEERAKIEKMISEFNSIMGSNYTLSNPMTYKDFMALHDAMNGAKNGVKFEFYEKLRTGPVIFLQGVNRFEDFTDEVFEKAVAHMKTTGYCDFGADLVDKYRALNEVFQEGSPTMQNCAWCCKSNVLSTESQKLLNKLAASYGLSLGTVDITKALSEANIEELLTNLSTVQSSQGAVNEDLSLRLNQAASERSAIFSQLQTLLQTLMQTIRQLSNW